MIAFPPLYNWLFAACFLAAVILMYVETGRQH